MTLALPVDMHVCMRIRVWVEIMGSFMIRTG
jgi:hypothetical protein